MGIEPILSAWKAEVLAIIRMAHNSALDSLSAININGDNRKLLLVPNVAGALGFEPRTSWSAQIRI